jgi:hypothetical protein
MGPSDASLEMDRALASYRQIYASRPAKEKRGNRAPSGTNGFLGPAAAGEINSKALDGRAFYMYKE